MPSSRNIKHTGYITYMEEEWRAVVGYEGYYMVSNLGKVKRTKVLKPDIVFGYERVTLCVNNKPKHYYLHCLVARSFISNPENKPVVNHIDNDRKNNNVSNLEWVTQMENINHCINQGRHTRGEMQGISDLKNNDIHYIRNSSLSTKELAIKYNQSEVNINRIKRYASWKHLP